MIFEEIRAACFQKESHKRAEMLSSTHPRNKQEEHKISF